MRLALEKLYRASGRGERRTFDRVRRKQTFFFGITELQFYSDRGNMVKNIIFKYVAYFVVFSLLALTETALGVRGFCVGLLFALLYCREKIYITVPMFAAGVLLAEFSLLSGITVAAGAVLGVVVYLIHLKKRYKYRLLETALLTFAAMVPEMAFTRNNSYAIAITALSVLIALVFHYISVIGLYPMLVRGLRYRLNAGEKFAMGALVAVMSVGLGVFRPFNVAVFYFAAAFVLMMLRGIDRASLVCFGVCAGLGAAIGEGSVEALAYISLLSLLCFGTSRMKSPFSAAAMALGYLVVDYFFNGAFDLWTFVPLAAGCFVGMLFPKKFFDKILAGRQGYRERYALRTVVNRDREELAERLLSVASAFSEMRALLESERPSSDDPEALVRSVCENGCMLCPRLNRCMEGVGDLADSVRRLVYAALDNGKASLLDASVGLGENCVKLTFLLNLANDSVKQYRKNQERKSGLEQGREMVVAQMGGTAQLLSSLARSVSAPLTFDPEPERKLIEKLGQANVVATDVCIYSGDEEKEMTVVVRESDVNKSCIKDIISDVAGCPMTELSRAKDVKGMAGLHFCRAPFYNVLYGESVSSKENRCGDTRQAVKIGAHKLMFILSDGMGTGKEAYLTANGVIKLIETFYKAGFDHRTVFSNVSRMLSMRRKEDFSALDVAIIDTQNGDIDFIKQGGRESYIFNGSEYEIIDGGSLPMGIIAEAEPVMERRRLKPDQLVLMMSDGVADAVNAGCLAEIIHKTSCQNPQNASDAVVADALRLAGRKDDMTVIALRLVRAS